MDRLLFASGYALDSGSRSYVSGLFDRLVGRGLDGAYARALVSLVRRLYCAVQPMAASGYYAGKTTAPDYSHLSRAPLWRRSA